MTSLPPEIQKAGKAEAQTTPIRPSGPLAFWSSGLLVFWLVLALCTLGFGAARLHVPGLVFDLAQQEFGLRSSLVGFHAIEHNADFVYRWTEPSAFVQVPWAYHDASHWRASVTLRVADTASARPVELRANERTLAVVMPQDRLRRYQLLLPPPATDSELRFALRTSPYQTPGDLRELGVIVTQIILTPIARADYLALSLFVLLPLGISFVLAKLGTFGEEKDPAQTPMRQLVDMLPLLAPLLACAAFVILYRGGPLPLAWLIALGWLGVFCACLLVKKPLARMALGLLSMLVVFSGTIWVSWLSDDAYISFQYSANLAHGYGLVYNIGERVEGYTNFLWTLLFALIIRLGGDIDLWSYLLGVVLGLALLLATFHLAQRLITTTWALAAALFVATSQSVLIYTARGAGLETGLFALLGLLGSTLLLSTEREQAEGQRTRRSENQKADILPVRRSMLAGLFFALAALTRPEGLLLFVISVAWLATRSLNSWRGIRLRALASTALRAAWPMLAVFVPIVLGFFLWRFWYYGEWLPNTFYAKTGGGLRQIERGLIYTGVFVLVFGGPLFVLNMIAVLSDWRRLLSDWRGYLLVLTGVYTAYIIVIGGDHFPGERFFVPLVPWFAVLSAAGMGRIVTWMQKSWSQRLAKGLVGVVLCGYCLFALGRTDYPSPERWATGDLMTIDQVLAGNTESLGIWRELGWWLHDNTPPQTSAAALGAGVIAYASDRPIIDLLGLTEKHIARISVVNMGAGTAGHEKRDPEYVLTVRQPQYIPRIWDEYFGGEHHLLANQYVLVHAESRYGRRIEWWKRK